MPGISATVITYNEEANIAEALDSLGWADEIVVVDSGSSDGTLEICRKRGVALYTRAWTGYVDQKNYAVDKATHDWIFSLDADERVSPALRREVAGLLSTGLRHPGYRIPRVAYFMGRWIRHGDWYPDYQLRLFDRRRGRWHGRRVHESVRLEGEPGFLSAEIHHFTYRDLSAYLRRLESYTTLAAADYRDRGRASSPLRMLLNPIATFVKAYFLKRGFLDGTPGLVVAIMGAVSVFFKYAKLWELQGKERGSQAAPPLSP